MSSTFEVSVEEVLALHPHGNADTLEIVELKDISYTIISKQGNNAIGDKVCLFMPDTIFPESMIKYFELDYLYKGNRVKTVKLRGVVSQALILPLTRVRSYIINELNIAPLDFELMIITNEPSLTEVLGVTKYEAPEPTDENSTGKLPEGCERYDIEGVEKHNNEFQWLINQDVDVVITEKMEGTNLAWHLYEDNTATACKRSSSVGEDSMYHKVAVERGWNNFATYLKYVLECRTVTIRGELIGENVQGNIYGVEKGAMIFDIKIDGEYIDWMFMNILVEGYNSVMINNGLVNGIAPKLMYTVPIIFQGRLRDYAKTPEEVKTLSNGLSELNPSVMREGIVIKPRRELRKERFGRMILKQHSPDYDAAKK